MFDIFVYPNPPPPAFLLTMSASLEDKDDLLLHLFLFILPKGAEIDCMDGDLIGLFTSV